MKRVSAIAIIVAAVPIVMQVPGERVVGGQRVIVRIGRRRLGGDGGALAGVPVLGALVSPDRWLLWLGLGFVLCVYFFPSGVVGRLRARNSNEPARGDIP